MFFDSQACSKFAYLIWYTIPSKLSLYTRTYYVRMFDLNNGVRVYIEGRLRHRNSRPRLWYLNDLPKLKKKNKRIKKKGQSIA